MEEAVVLEWSDLVGGVDHLVAPQAVTVHVVCLEHDEAMSGWIWFSICWHFYQHHCHLQREESQQKQKDGLKVKS